MTFSQSLLPEYDREMDGARRTLDRFPDGKGEWRPHPRSMTFGRLASHLAEIPGWALMTIERDSIDIAPVGQPAPQAANFATRKEILALFDKNVPLARAALAGASDEHLMKPWSLMRAGQPIMTMPRVVCLRGFIMNHLIHHRAQLGVYLRLNDIAVPSIYGPSADEGSL